MYPPFACTAIVSSGRLVSPRRSRTTRLARTALEGLAEHEKLDLVVDGQDTSTGDTTENVGTGTLEERADALSGNDLATGIERRLVLDGL